MPDKPPPDEEQIEVVREYGSQLEYAFRGRPEPGADGRHSWERRFLATFSRMLQILAVAKFEYLPPFSIACIWENNRRSHAQEPVFDIECIRDGYDQAHPAYHGQTQLVYQPAYDGRFCTIPEAQLRNVWWSQRPLGGVFQVAVDVQESLTLLNHDRTRSTAHCSWRWRHKRGPRSG